MNKYIFIFISLLLIFFLAVWIVARSLYDNAPNPKEFYLMEGAAHTNLYEFDRENYQKIVLSFLSKYID